MDRGTISMAIASWRLVGSPGRMALRASSIGMVKHCLDGAASKEESATLILIPVSRAVIVRRSTAHGTTSPAIALCSRDCSPGMPTAQKLLQLLTGSCQGGWQTVNGKRYYFDWADGKSLRWSQWIDGSLYYFNTESEMVTGWVTWKADGSKSYFDGNGRALMEWQTIGGKTYYFNPSNGQSLRGMHVIDGHSYYFNEHSELVGGKSETKTETTGVSLTTLAAKELSACSSALKYTQADIVASMTPTNYGAGTSGYYQFAQLNHGYSGMVSAAQLDAYIASTASGRTRYACRERGRHL